MNISVIWWFDKASETYPNWRDGLRGAIEEIGKTHKVTWFFDKELPKDEFDAYLIWGDSNCEAIDLIKDYRGKKGLLLTTNPNNLSGLMRVDVVYCESTPIYRVVRSQGIHAVSAFGTDTDFFTPDDTKKDIEYFYPATFSPWKLQRDIAHLGTKLTCIGTMQPDGVFDLARCVENGVNVEEGYFPAEKIRDCYRRSQKVIIPAVHGSERTVLEAMACGIKPEVTNDVNVRAKSYVEELEDSGLSPREFVVKYYSHKKYATDIMKGLI